MYKQFTSNAGHSHATEGAVGNGYKEHVEALKYNAEFIKQMKAAGYSVTNTTSEAKGAQAVLSEQARKANAVNKDGRLDVSWHFNSASDKKATGVEVLYYDQKELAEKVSASMAKALGIRNRGAKERKELYFLRNTKAPSILIEVAFISNADDMKQATAKRIAVVAAIVEALTGKKGKKGTKRVWVKEPKGLNIRSGGDWDSKVAFNLPYTYTAIIDYDQTLNGFVKVIWGDKEGWFSAALEPYWFDKDPCVEYICQMGLNFRAGQNWNTKVVQSRKKGDVVRVIGQVNKWYKVVLSGGVVGYIPVNNLYLKKK